MSTNTAIMMGAVLLVLMFLGSLSYESANANAFELEMAKQGLCKRRAGWAIQWEPCSAALRQAQEMR